MSDLLKDKSGALDDDDLKDVAGGRIFNVRRPFFLWGLFRKNDLVFNSNQQVTADDLVGRPGYGSRAHLLGENPVQGVTEPDNSDMIET